MTSQVNIQYGAATALPNAAGLNSAAAAAYINLGEVDNSSAKLLDYLVEVAVTPSAAPSGNAQIVIFAQDSVDGTNYSDSSQDANMALLGTIQMSAAQAYRSRAMSVAAAFGGVMPEYVRIIAKIDDGVALAATGNSAQYVGINDTVG